MPPKKKPAKVADSTPQAEKKKIVRPRRKSLRNSKEISNDVEVNEDPQKDVPTPAAPATRFKRGPRVPNLHREMKIALANEVVQAHFQKPNNLTPICEITIPVSKKPILKRKYVQNKKKINSETVEDNTDVLNKSGNSPTTKKARIVRKNSTSKIAITCTVDNSEDNVIPSKEIKKKFTPRRKLSLNRKKLMRGLVRTIVNDYIPEPSQDTVSQEKQPEKKPEVENKCNVVAKKENQENNSRRSSSEFSWTKDISSSSTTTCVTVMSNDFFRIDNKIPFVKLTKLVIPKEESSDSSDSSSDSESSSDQQIELDVSSNALNLSSTSSSLKSSVIHQKSIHDKILDALKTFNSEQINWTSGDDDVKDTNVFKEQLKKDSIFQDELMLLSLWLDITNLEPDKDINTTHDTTNEVLNDTSDTLTPVKQDRKQESFTSSAGKSRLDHSRTRHIDEDDDDALSLFAESITDVESCRRNSIYSHLPEPPSIEEYIPQPISPDVFKKPKPVSYYNPSKISELSQKTSQLIICEKQNADSTSVRSDFDADVSVNNFTGSESGSTGSDEPRKISKQTTFMGMSCKPIELVKSTILRGVCVFNLIDNCKNSQCNFPHVYPDVSVIQHKLERLSDDAFIQEYLLVRNLNQLRHLYGLCFIDESVRRKLTRCLVEMSLDFIVKTKDNSIADAKLKTEAVERTLLYLNFVDLNQCEDLLKCEVKPGVLLCDVYLEVIGHSQNFYRFRTVFINLTMLMCHLDRTFDSEVAGQILERVCILPFEFSLNRTLMEILKKTDPIVFSNSMCGHLEKRLLTTNEVMYEEFVALKQRMPEVSQSSVIEKDIRCSPDTTNFDNANKIQAEFNRATEINNSFTNKMKNLKNRRFKKRWGPGAPRSPRPNGTPEMFGKRALLMQPLNSLFHSPIFSPRQNPGNILRNMKNKQ